MEYLIFLSCSVLLTGYIISIETQGMKCDNIRRFDADCADWAEYWTEFQRNERFIIVLRIFYIVMAGISEEIIGKF